MLFGDVAAAGVGFCQTTDQLDVPGEYTDGSLDAQLGTAAVAFPRNPQLEERMEALARYLGPDAQLRKCKNHITIAVRIAGRPGSSTRPEIAAVLLRMMLPTQRIAIGIDSASALAAVSRATRRAIENSSSWEKPWQL